MNLPPAPAPWQLAARTARMNPSAIREILKLTERPGIISLAGGLPSADTFPIEAMREATARVLRDTPREALQYAASEGFASAARMGRRRDGAPRHDGRCEPSADHDRLAAGPRPGRQGADRCRQPGRRRIADLPRRAAGLRAVRARVRAVACDDEGPLPEAIASACARRALSLRAAQFPEPDRPLDRAARAASRSPRGAEAAGVPIVEDNPYGDLWYDARAAGADRCRTGARARSISAASRRYSRRACAWAT